MLALRILSLHKKTSRPAHFLLAAASDCSNTLYVDSHKRTSPHRINH